VLSTSADEHRSADQRERVFEPPPEPPGDLAPPLGMLQLLEERVNFEASSNFKGANWYFTLFLSLGGTIWTQFSQNPRNYCRSGSSSGLLQFKKMGSGSRSKWLCLLLLLIVTILNQWDKYQLVYLSSTSVCTKHGEPCYDLPATDVTLCGDLHTKPNSSLQRCHECLRGRDLSHINMQEATCTSTVQYGLLTGYAFTVLYVIGAVLGGVFADALQLHKTFLIISLLVWSAAAAAQALASAWWHLLLLRLVLGAAESLATPTSQTILGRTFPPGTKGTALGMLSVGIYMGGGLSSLSILFAQGWLGWRGTVLLGGIGGVLVAPLLVCFLPSDDGCAPARRTASFTACGCRWCASVYGSGTAAMPQALASQPHDSMQPRYTDSAAAMSTQPDSEPMEEESVGPSTLWAPVLSSWRGLLHLIRLVLAPPAVKWILLAAGCRYMAGLSVGAFQPKFFAQAYPQHSDEYAVWNAAIVGIVGSISSIAGGFLGDWLIVMRDKSAGQQVQGSPPCSACSCLSGFSWENASARGLLVPVLGSVLAVPPFILMVTSHAFAISLLGLALTYLGAESWFGPTLAFLFAQIPEHAQGTAAGMFSLFANVIGSAGPAAVGGLVDGPFNGQVGAPLLAVITAAYSVSIVAFLLAWRATSSPAPCTDGMRIAGRPPGYVAVDAEASLADTLQLMPKQA